ncbi:MAG: hypothetical protein ACK5V3_15590 [Bdellovibrionales bacterium]
MLKYLTPTSWTLFFLMLLLGLYIQAHKITRNHKINVPSVIGASYSR